MDIQKQRQLLQDLLVEGKLDSLSVQVIALNVFANSLGYKAVNGDIRKGFVGYDHDTWNVTHNLSLEDMQYKYNYGLPVWLSRVSEGIRLEKQSKRVLERVSLQYNKRKSKQLITQLQWLKFIKEE